MSLATAVLVFLLLLFGGAIGVGLLMTYSAIKVIRRCTRGFSK